MGQSVDNVVNKMKEAFEENPLGVILAISTLFAGTAKLVNAFAGIQSKRAYAHKYSK
jgi:hypothetical protein